MPVVDVTASGISESSASMPIVMYGRLTMSAHIRGQSKKKSSTLHTAKCRHTYANANSPSSRRSVIGHDRPNRMRSGVIASDASRIRKVQSPSVLVMKLMGLAPRSSVQARWAKSVSGARQIPHTATLSPIRAGRVTAVRSVVLLQVHPGVERRHLLGISVERKCGAAAKLTDAPLVRLAPARMADGRIDVGVEAVFLRRRLFPGGLGLLADQPDPDDRLGTLEAVLPRHHHPHRRAVLIRQHLAVHAHRQKRQRVHRLVQPEPLDVGPVERRAEESGFLARELVRVEQGRELDVLRLPVRLDT